jgi:hypothetical protein
MRCAGTMSSVTGDVHLAHGFAIQYRSPAVVAADDQSVGAVTDGKRRPRDPAAAARHDRTAVLRPFGRGNQARAAPVLAPK